MFLFSEVIWIFFGEHKVKKKFMGDSTAHMGNWHVANMEPADKPSYYPYFS